MLSIWNPWAWACLWPPNCRRNRISCFLNLYAEPSACVGCREFLEKQVFIGEKLGNFVLHLIYFHFCGSNIKLIGFWTSDLRSISQFPKPETKSWQSWICLWWWIVVGRNWKSQPVFAFCCSKLPNGIPMVVVDVVVVISISSKFRDWMTISPSVAAILIIRWL